MRGALSALAYGVHLGEGELRRELPGFSVCILQPKFHEEDAPLHTHGPVSIVFVLAGAYRTTADGPTSRPCGETLIYNPGATTIEITPSAEWPPSRSVGNQ